MCLIEQIGSSHAVLPTRWPHSSALLQPSLRLGSVGSHVINQRLTQIKPIQINSNQPNQVQIKCSRKSSKYIAIFDQTI
jgi:hypothetical protein